MKKPTPTISEEHFYYIRQIAKGKFPRITVCLLKFADGIFCRGISLCSFSEPKFMRKKAFAMAKGRAVQAHIHRNNVQRIKRTEARKVLDSCQRSDFWFKGEFNVEPFYMEKMMLEKGERK